MKDIAIYGAGGFGREVACLIKHINRKNPQWNLVGFFDDGKKIGDKNEYGEILGGINEVNNWKTPLAVAVAIGSPRTVSNIVEQITNPLIEYPNLFAPDIFLVDSDNISFGKGNIVSYGCLFSCNVHIGNFNTFNGFITIGHDAVIGDFNSFMPAVRISGEVKIGKMNFFGVSSVVLQQIKIGNDTVIGGNSIVIRKTSDGNTYVGNPAVKINFKK